MIEAPVTNAPNVVWAVDFQFDVREQGRALKICSIVDEHTPECIGGLVERSSTANRFIDHLETRIVQCQIARRMHEYQQFLLTTARTSHHRRLETPIPPRPQALIAGYLAPADYAQTCTQVIQKNDSHTVWT